MKMDIVQPCPSCPYRRDAPLAKWHRQHFETLLVQDHPFGALYACHGTGKKKTQSFCAGWMLDQLERGLPNLNLRLFLARNNVTDETLDLYQTGDLEMYESLEEMCEENLKRDDLLREMGVIVDVQKTDT